MYGDKMCKHVYAVMSFLIVESPFVFSKDPSDESDCQKVMTRTMSTECPPHGDRQGQAWVKEQQARTLEQVAYTDLYRLIDVLRTFVNYWCQRAEQCIVG